MRKKKTQRGSARSGKVSGRKLKMRVDWREGIDLEKQKLRLAVGTATYWKSDSASNSTGVPAMVPK